ncbi:GAD-like domain-containing protein [Cystobacter fuscus]
MRDEDFEIFVENFGEATHREAVPELSFEKFRGVLPQQLLSYWKEEGWCGYAKGLVWTVNPEKYSGLVKLWLADTPYEKLDAFHVIARSAFGDLYAWGERTNRYVVIGCPENALIVMDKEFRKVQKNQTGHSRVLLFFR